MWISWKHFPYNLEQILFHIQYFQWGQVVFSVSVWQDRVSIAKDCSRYFWKVSRCSQKKYIDTDTLLLKKKVSTGCPGTFKPFWEGYYSAVGRATGLVLVYSGSGRFKVFKRELSSCSRFYIFVSCCSFTI